MMSLHRVFVETVPLAPLVEREANAILSVTLTFFNEATDSKTVHRTVPQWRQTGMESTEEVNIKMVIRINITKIKMRIAVDIQCSHIIIRIRVINKIRR